MDHFDQVKGKVFIVTAAGDAAQAKAACYVARGACVVLAGADHARCLVLARDLGVRAVAVDADVSSAAGWLNAVRATLDIFGRIDGVVDDGSIHDPSREEDDRSGEASSASQAAGSVLDDAILV